MSEFHEKMTLVRNVYFCNNQLLFTDGSATLMLEGKDPSVSILKSPSTTLYGLHCLSWNIECNMCSEISSFSLNITGSYVHPLGWSQIHFGHDYLGWNNVTLPIGSYHIEFSGYAVGCKIMLTDVQLTEGYCSTGQSFL